MAHRHDSYTGHEHSSIRKANKSRIKMILVLAAVYMFAEVIGGWITNSLALLTDAGHMLSDVGSLGLSLFALTMATRPPTPEKSYGYYRTEMLAALFNGATLIAISIFIFVEAYQRFKNPPVVQGELMTWIAAGGLAVNLFGLWMLRDGRSNSLNVRGAWLHIVADTLGSVGVLVAGILIIIYGWSWIDSAVSVVIGVLVAYSSWGLLRESVNVLMESAPNHINVDEVRNEVMTIHGVASMHDLHVWSITSDVVALSCHVRTSEPRDPCDLIDDIHARLYDKFGIEHITIQVESREMGEHGLHE